MYKFLTILYIDYLINKINDKKNFYKNFTVNIPYSKFIIYQKKNY